MRLGLDGYFDTVVCEEDTVCHKPEAEPLECYMRRAGARPEEVLYIGDSIYDMECARAAKTACGLALWGAVSVGAYPRRIITSRIRPPCSRFWSGWTQRMKGKWISWAMELQFIAQAGVTYSKDRFDLERF